MPAIGWDYRLVSANNGSGKSVFQDYQFQKPLRQGSFIAATLTWDRRVELKDTNGNGQYDLDEEFQDRGLNNLDLYLLRADDNQLSQPIHASISQVDGVEHIFFPIPETGRYKLRVHYRQRANEADQDYALAWWTAE